MHGWPADLWRRKLKYLAAFILLLWSSIASAADITNPQNITGMSRVVGTLRGANFNSTADQAIPIAVSVYQVTGISVTNCSASLTLAVGGFYPTTAKGGTPVVAATQLYSALTSATVLLSSTIAASPLVTRFTANPLYLSLTTAQGSPATCDIYVIGVDLT
jgi:hypothetical protein